MRSGVVFSSVLHVALVALLVYGLPDDSRELTLGGGTAVPVVFQSSDGQAGQANERRQIQPPDEASAPADPSAPDQPQAEAPSQEEPSIEQLITASGAVDAPPETPTAPPEVPLAVPLEKPSLAAPETPDISLATLPESLREPASQEEPVIQAPESGTTAEPQQSDRPQPDPLPNLPDQPSLEVVTAPVTQPLPQADAQPVEELSPDPMTAPETSPTLTENPSTEPPLPMPAPQVASEEAPPEPTLQTSPDLPAESDNPDPDEVAPQVAEAPEPIPQPAAETVEELLEPQPEAPTSTRPGPEVKTPEEIPAPPAPQVASVPEPTTAPTPPAPAQATAPQAALSVPPSKPKRDITLPESRPEQQQVASTKPETGRQETTTRQENAADDLISRLAGGGSSAPQQQASNSAGSGSRGARGRLSNSDENKIVRAVGRYWNVPCGQRGIDGVVVEIRLQMNQNGSVARWEILDPARYNGDPTYRSVADSAIRAIHQAQPLPFPPNNYDLWRDVKLNFPAREVCN